MKDILKKEEIYNLNFYANIDKKQVFFDCFKKFCSLKKNIEYVEDEKNAKNSLKNGRDKDLILNEFIELFFNTKEGLDIQKEINKLYNEMFSTKAKVKKEVKKEVENPDTKELLEKGTQKTLDIKDEKPTKNKVKENKPKKVKEIEEPITKIIEEEKPFQLLRKAKL